MTVAAMSIACSGPAPAPDTEQSPASSSDGAFGPAAAGRKYLVERVDEAAIVQLYADGFAALPVKERILTWHLYQAAIAGRDN